MLQLSGRYTDASLQTAHDKVVKTLTETEVLGVKPFTPAAATHVAEGAIDAAQALMPKVRREAGKGAEEKVKPLLIGAYALGATALLAALWGVVK